MMTIPGLKIWLVLLNFYHNVMNIDELFGYLHVFKRHLVHESVQTMVVLEELRESALQTKSDLLENRRHSVCAMTMSPE